MWKYRVRYWDTELNDWNRTGLRKTKADAEKIAAWFTNKTGKKATVYLAD